MNTATAAVVAASGLALYIGHHVGDYWVQTDHQAQHKGDTGWAGRWACGKHVATYTLTQGVALAALFTVTGGVAWYAVALALAVSAATHYLADRRAYGLMFRMVRWLEPISGKASFMALGTPRSTLVVDVMDTERPGRFVEKLDRPSLGTGAWALDQAWHIALGVFVPALIIGGLS